MKTWTKYGAGLALLAGWASYSLAQVPPVPGGPAAGAAAAAAPGAAAAAGPNLFTFLCLPDDKVEKIKKCLCEVPLFRSMLGSVGSLGGLTGLGPIIVCPDPVAEAVKDALAAGKEPDAATAAAAAIKADTAAAKARREAVRYLGTVECNWWPEAEKALIKSLREDKNECVRLEAALALGNGCCCTKDTIKALAATVSGEANKEGSKERCERVRAAAYLALTKCLACYYEVEPAGKKDEKIQEKPQEKPAEKPGEGSLTMKTVSTRKPTYYPELENVPMSAVVQDAQRVVAGAGHMPTLGMPISSGSRGLLEIYSRAANAPAVGMPKNLDGGMMVQETATGSGKPTLLKRIGLGAKLDRALMTKADPNPVVVQQEVIVTSSPTNVTTGATFAADRGDVIVIKAAGSRLPKPATK